MGATITYLTPEEEKTLVNTRLNKQLKYLATHDSLEHHKRTLRAHKAAAALHHIQPEPLHVKHRPFFYHSGKAWTSQGFKENT